MIVLDPGHVYDLATLDGDGTPQRLTFVKREGPRYPGNIGHHPGVIIQEVLRSLIDRCGYVNAQIPCAETEAARDLLRAALVLFELRAARVHGRQLEGSAASVVAGPGCPVCGHVGCSGHAGGGV